MGSTTQDQAYRRIRDFAPPIIKIWLFFVSLKACSRPFILSAAISEWKDVNWSEANGRGDNPPEVRRRTSDGIFAE
jgi:hypothetical protein